MIYRDAKYCSFLGATTTYLFGIVSGSVSNGVYLLYDLQL